MSLLAGGSAKDVYEGVDAHSAVDSHDGTEGFLHGYCAVDPLGWIETDVAVAAVMVHGLVEVAEEYAAAAER